MIEDWGADFARPGSLGRVVNSGRFVTEPEGETAESEPPGVEPLAKLLVVAVFFC
jgi:hypothetical protein